MRKLHTSVFAGKFNTYRNAYGFRIVNDTQGKKIVLEVSSLPEMEVIDSSVYWTYYDLEQCLLTKLKALFFVYADSDMRDGTVVHYTQADIYLDPSLENLLKLIDRGRLMIDIRIGSYKTGKMKGKPHDHGTGFRIRPEDLCRCSTSIICISTDAVAGRSGRKSESARRLSVCAGDSVL